MKKVYITKEAGFCFRNVKKGDNIVTLSCGEENAFNPALIDPRTLQVFMKDGHIKELDGDDDDTEDADNGAAEAGADASEGADHKGGDSNLPTDSGDEEVPGDVELKSRLAELCVFEKEDLKNKKLVELNSIVKEICDTVEAPAEEFKKKADAIAFLTGDL
jgi:hypothetical protein